MAKTDNLSDFLTDVANSIRTKTGTTEQINAQDFSNKILSIAQPTLFAPTITEGINVISWENNEQNGGFPVTVTAKIDDTTYTSPLYITEALNNKTLSITASSTDFNNAITTKALNYISAPNYSGGIVVSGLNVDDTYSCLRVVSTYGSPDLSNYISIINATTSEIVSPEIATKEIKQTNGMINSNYIIRKDGIPPSVGDVVVSVHLNVDYYRTKNLNIKIYKNGIFMTEKTIALSSLQDNYTRYIIPDLVIDAGFGGNPLAYYLGLYETDPAEIEINDSVSFQLTLSDPA